MTRADRLTDNRDFSRVYRKGSWNRGRWIGLHVLTLRGKRMTGPPRVGFAVNREMRSAVQRNRMKRLLREAFRLEETDLVFGIDVVVSGRWKPGQEPHLRELIEELGHLMNKAGIARERSIPDGAGEHPAGRLRDHTETLGNERGPKR